MIANRFCPRSRCCSVIDMELPSGWLIKRGETVKNWMKRWVQFVEEDELMLIYDRPSGRLKRTVRLESIESVACMPESGKKFAFAIQKNRGPRSPLYKTICFSAENKDSFDSWFGAFASCVERNKRVLENVRKAIFCFLAIRRFRREECGYVGTVCNDVMGIIVGMIWESRFSDRRKWLFNSPCIIVA